MLQLLSHSSYLGIIVVLVFTGMGLPIPEEVPVIAAGVLSSNGTLKPELAFFSCLIGALLGDCVMYAMGYHFGRGILDEHPRFTGFLTPEREQQIERMLLRHAFWAMFLARFVVGLRSPMYLTAGILRFSFRRFILIDGFCATTVIGLFFGLSYRYGDQIATWVRNSQVGLTVILIIVAITVAVVLITRQKHKKELESSLGEEKAGSTAKKPATSRQFRPMPLKRDLPH